MATNILMPALSPTMTEGKLARWLKKEGEAVKSGDVLAEIETDKATMEVEAVDEGVLGRILVADGTEGVKVNDPIAILVAAGEAVPATASAAPAPAPASSASATSAAPAAKANGQDTPMAAPAPAAGGRVFASPLARRMAKLAGIDLSTLTGTGPHGRIVKADIDAVRSRAARPAPSAPGAPPLAPAPAPALAPAAPAAPAPATAVAISAPHKLVPHSIMRKVIARRLTEAKASIPHFYLSMDVGLDSLLDLRATLNAKSPKDGPGAFKLSVNDFIIKAAAVALRRVPGTNASWTDQGIALYDDVDISVAVAIPDGLITPIIRQADRKGLAAISNEMKELAARAKNGKLKPEEYQGGGFSISNLGMFGIKDFAAIINPPQGAILAVGAGEKRAVVKDGALAIATQMTCTLSVDHRVVDGALGAEFLAAFRGLIEEPLSLML
ncbi:MAG: pyruvate dehydrogenase complex dihydrolipoamide acetyltransferase [Acetobacteraceae bacterium]